MIKKFNALLDSPWFEIAHSIVSFGYIVLCFFVDLLGSPFFSFICGFVLFGGLLSFREGFAKLRKSSAPAPGGDK